MEHFHVVASNQLPQDVMHARLEGFSSRPSNYAAFVMYVTSFVPTQEPGNYIAGPEACV